ncbi:MAG: gluconate 2-dehydrogenase subunit 3 family protein [Acidobacteria bacterium]|nr:gluconate 2-dehydrogenase subunit 3 family protein [Acidobacteriota bacterium]
MLGSAAVISAFPPDALALFQQAHAQAAQSPGLKAFNPHQDATVIAISEAIIPATDTPGAKAAKVNEFIDLLMGEWYEPADSARFLDGLDDVDKRSRRLFSKDFVDCTVAQQEQLLRALDGEAMTFAKQQSAALLAKKPAPPANFFYTMKKLTLAGYYTSEIGFEKELGKSIIPPSHAGCAPLTAEVNQ